MGKASRSEKKEQQKKREAHARKKEREDSAKIEQKEFGEKKLRKSREEREAYEEFQKNIENRKAKGEIEDIDIRVFRKDRNKIFKSYDKEKRTGIFKKLEELITNPECGKPLKDNLHGLRSVNKNPLRIIYKYYKDGKYILIVKIGDRSEIYEDIKIDENLETFTIIVKPI